MAPSAAAAFFSCFALIISASLKYIHKHTNFGHAWMWITFIHVHVYLLVHKNLAYNVTCFNWPSKWEWNPGYWFIQRVIVFLASFVYPGLDLLWATRRVFLEKQRTLILPLHLVMHPVFSGIRVAHLILLLCMYDFGYFKFFVLYVCFPCLVFVPALHSFDYRYNLGSLDYSLI